ncbi:TDT family transporter [Gordonia soli]|uniref:Putative TDT family transporter n=1 Tax=Gordonia soli NBRC 108243 TaxID=1223545 RepID=M0QG82_9ACTN|nr:TDT family transporter [Gordonia soli]GAC67593.1 putative TDT family transporter [Gordonia soli NBRC 108243]
MTISARDLHADPSAPGNGGARGRTADGLFAHVTPNWFAAVMGTGIVATATMSVAGERLRTEATMMWLLATVLLVAVSIAFGTHWLVHRERARGYADHPVVALFYGALPMAILTVGCGAVSLGGPVLGVTISVWVGVGLWVLGTLVGLLTCSVIPLRMLTGSLPTTLPVPAWLMPVVPPMVSASTGAVLLPHLHGVAREVLLWSCYGLFVISLIAGAVVLRMVARRLMFDGWSEVQATPTVWISLGILGQSITAANLLGDRSALVLTGDRSGLAAMLDDFGIVFGSIMVLVVAAVFAGATAMTVRAARRGLRYSLSWWSFTFPVGTCVTGTAALAHAAGLPLLHIVSAVLLLLLVAAWTIVAVLTVRHAPRWIAGP